jgi:hypothetical protein
MSKNLTLNSQSNSLERELSTRSATPITLAILASSSLMSSHSAVLLNRMLASRAACPSSITLVTILLTAGLSLPLS